MPELPVETINVRLTEHDDTFTRSTDPRVDNTWNDPEWGEYDEQVWHSFEDCRAVLPERHEPVTVPTPLAMAHYVQTQYPWRLS